MAGKTKPKRVRRVWDRLNPIEVALNAATKLTAEERAEVMKPRRESLTALRFARATEMQWLHLATCAQVAMCIEDQGIVRGLRKHLEEADLALCAIADRGHASGAWCSPTCYGQELSSIDTLLTLHAFQIEQLSAKEYRRAIELAKARQLTNGGRVVLERKAA